VSSSRWLAALLAVLTLAACGDVPRPFQPARKLADPRSLIAPKADASLAITSVTGLPGALGADLAELVAFDLRERGVPAFTDFANKSSWWLYGDYRTDPPRIEWSLIDPEGKGATNLTTAAPGARPDAKVVDAMAKAAVPQIEKAVRIDPGPEQQPMKLAVLFEGVTGAPGDGNESLGRAMQTELARMGLKLAEAPGEGVLRLGGTVSLTDAGSEQRVAIAWRLADPKGAGIGTIAQENAIPRGRLDRTWGDIAWVAAQGGAYGLQDLLQAAARATAAR
jgi:predicted small lipoprotein YifL